jgi:hypothetical protein
MTSPLHKEFEYYLAHQNDIVKKHDGKFVVIKDLEIIGVYDDELQAVHETQKEHQPGTFLVQYVSHGEADYTQTFHSRVAFS